MSRHVVFGTGQVGAQLVAQLVADGEDVVAVSRSGRGPFPAATIVAGDATDPAFTTEVSAGADVLYFCLDAPDYGKWPEQFPPLQRGVLAAAQATGARLVVQENLYGYGPVGRKVLVETLPLAATSAKARTRIAMTEELVAAHAAGTAEVVIGRASDYFGPGCTHSALGELVFEPALTGRRAQVMGDLDQPHSYSYTPDVARGLIALGRADADATGQVWHLPVAGPWTTRQVIDHVYGLAGHRPKALAAGRTSLRLYGVVNRAMKEYLHTLYQFTDPWIVSDTKFTDRFGFTATPLPTALAVTLRSWSEPGVSATTTDDAHR